MKIAEVAGMVVSPISHPFFEGQRLLLCDLVDTDGSTNGYLIAVDVCGQRWFVYRKWWFWKLWHPLIRWF